MTWRPARSLLVLHRQLQEGSRATPPATDRNAWGLLADGAHDPTSDHAPHDFRGWGNDIVTAADFPNRPDLGLDAHRVLDDIRRSRDARVKYGISNGQQFSSYPTSSYAAWTWRPYNPKNGDRHFTHGHLSVVGDSRADGIQPWQTIGANMALTDDDIKKLLDANLPIPGWDTVPAEWRVFPPASEQQQLRTILGGLHRREFLLVRGLTAVWNKVVDVAEAVKGLDARVSALGPVPSVPQEQFNVAVAAALADPTIVAGLVAAINNDAARRLAES